MSTSVASILDQLRRLGVQPGRLCADSRQVQAGDIFVALPGKRVDGRNYIDQAIARGASAVLYEAGSELSLPIPALAIPQLSALIGPLADYLYGQPSRQLRMIGVTGTNGKTSITHWLAQALGQLQCPAAVIGTLGCGQPGQLAEGLNTTPDAISLQQTLAQFHRDGLQACAMEVSSIGIAEHRVAGVHFDLAVFTNLTLDHLDYHGDMAAYGAAKARLFAWPDLGTAVINLDDAFGRQLVANSAKARQTPVIGYTLGQFDRLGQKEFASLQEYLVAQEIDFRTTGLTRFKVGQIPFEIPVIGRFNVANALAVIGSLRALGYQLADIAPAMRNISAPPGRMEVVSVAGYTAEEKTADEITAAENLGPALNQPLVVVDYAHTPDALTQALTTLRETAAARDGRLICVFGCGGDRDPSKRPIMGAAAETGADEVWLTSDNPRSESPTSILAAIAQGMRRSAHIEADRALAIGSAIQSATENDVILIAGKGHEPYQEIAGQRYPFSDEQHARNALRNRTGKRPERTS